MTRFIKLLIVFCFSAAPAGAEELLAPLQFKGTYYAAMAGIPFGQIDIGLSQDAVSYDITSDVITTGIARIFVKHKSHTTSKGRGTAFHYGDVEYASNYSTRDKPKRARFSKKSDVMVHAESLPRDEKRPLVPQELQNTSYDPLAIALGIRVELARAIKGGPKNFSLDYFDGKRLYRCDFAYLGEKNVRIKSEKYPTYLVQSSRKLIAGFTPKESDKKEKAEPSMNIYFSKDGRLIPLKLEAPVGMVAASAVLAM